MHTALLTEIEQYRSTAEQFQLQQPLQHIEHLLQDIESDAYTFIVVGEFSTGKSSFINALIGEPLLPVGVIPTTATINVLQYGEPHIDIHYLDGTIEQANSSAILDQFIAKRLDDASHINYINVFQPLSFLKNNVLLIDTPGLNDVNELRSDITYQYIPRAHIVFFLLDCRTPLRQSEFTFLTDTLLSQGLDRIVFVANFADAVDEAELPLIVERIKRELQAALPELTIDIIPFSAVEAIDAIAEQDDELLHISGYYDVHKKITALCESSSRIEETARRYKQRAAHIQFELADALQQLLLLSEQTELQLTMQKEKVDAWQEQQHIFLRDLEAYRDEQVHDFKQMASKSVATFFKKMESELIERIELYEGSQFVHFFEKEIPAMLRSKMKHWMEQYAPHLHVLISKLEQSLTDVLTTTLQQRVYIQAIPSEELAESESVNIRVQKTSDPLLTSGLMIGGASTLFLALGGTLLLPIMAMVGLPYLQKKMLQDQLNKLRPQVISDLQVNLLTVQHDFEQNVHTFIEDNANKVYDSALKRYNEAINTQQQAIYAQQQRIACSAQDEKEHQQNIYTALNSYKLLTI
ncbi:dynamin family protein [Caryophanon latum]|uniref:Dynamin-type G domain-containing protein n=1 Tax=Caryophanon latum TaxID=33977 RepID=A0A1C0YB02_9BACL|nr:dynamin family protein [Caryophanon latum]OCS84352.1 hypothetical protein A6K76_15715 [Caryophanon latum]